MGLREKRRIRDLSEEVIPSLVQEVKDLCGKEILWDVDWDSFTDMESLDNIEHQGLRRVVSAFRSICYDDLGKNGVRDALNKIVVKNFSDASQLKITFENGVLTLHGAWGAGWDGYPREEEIQRLLEDNL